MDWNCKFLQLGHEALTAIQFDPHSKYMVVGDKHGRIQAFDSFKYEPLTDKLSLAMYEITDLKFTPGGKFLAVAFGTGLVNLYDCKDRRFNFIT